MYRLIVAALLIVAAAGSTAAAQTTVASTALGDAYYEFLMALHLETQGDGAAASAAYERAERLDPTSAEIPAALAELYARMNRPSDAIAAGERAVKADPSNPEANWILGSLYARMAEMPTTRDQDRLAYTKRAIENLEKADRKIHPGVSLLLSRLFLSTREFEKAIALLVPLVEAQPDQLQGLVLLAEAYQATNRKAEAFKLLESAVEDAPELYGTLAQMYESSDRWADAARAYQGAVAERPQSVPLRTDWAAALLQAGEPRRAREVIEEVSSAASRNARALYVLSEAQRRTRDFGAAEASVRRMIALDAKSLLGPRQLALILRDQGEHQKVVALLEPIVTARFRTADAAEVTNEVFQSLYFDLVATYEALKQFDKASAILTQARMLSPSNPRVHSRLARTQLNAGKGETAIATMQQAVAAFPDEPAVKLELAAILERQRRYSEAEKVFRELIAADPKNADALNSFGYMLAERGQRLTESVSMVERALAIDPGNAAYLDSLGWAYYKQNRLDLAEAPLREAAQKLPTVSVIQSHLGDLLNRRERYEEAIDAWQLALDGDLTDVSRPELERKIRSARQKLGHTK